MDVNDIVNALNGILDLGDTLDNAGIGMSAATDGEHTTRDIIQLELGAFLLYIGDGAGFFTDGQAGLVNLILSDQYGQMSTWQMKSAASNLSEPDPSNNMTYTVFDTADEIVAEQNGKLKNNQSSNAIISLYESFGQLMIALNQNAVSRMRYDRFMRGLRARQTGGGFTAPAQKKPSSSAAAKSTVGANVDISPYIPVGVTLTDNQKEYLCAIVDLINRYGPVDSSTVAMHMHKSTSAVSSAVSTLMKKGILDKNDDAKIIIAERNSATETKQVSSGKAKSSPKSAIVKKTSGGSGAKFNDRVSFALPGEYKMQWEKDDNGKDSCKIVSIKHSDGDDDTPETTVMVSIPENNSPGRDPFEVIQEGDDKSTFIPFGSDPEALLSITYLDMQILSINFRTSLYRLFIRLSEEETLLLFLTTTSSDGENTFYEDFTKLTDIWRSLRIDGEAVDLGEADSANSLVTYLTELQENGGKPKKKKATSSKTASDSKEKTKSREKKLIIRTKPAAFPDAEQYKGIHEVEDEAERVNLLGTWSIPVSPGCSYTMDPDYTAGGFSGKYPLQIQSTEDRNFDKAYDSRFNFALFATGARCDAFSALIDLSSDEALDEMTRLAANADSQYAFLKRTSGLAIMTKDVTVKQKEYGAMFLIFSRGTQYVANGQIVVRGKSKKAAKEEAEVVLKTIIPVEQPGVETGYKPVVLPQRYGLTFNDHKTVKLDGDIALPVPDGFKGSTDQKKIGEPRKFSIVPEDYADFSKAMDARIGITGLALQGDPPSYSQEYCDQVLNNIRDTLKQNEVFIEASPIIIAQKTTKGVIVFQKAFGMDTYQYITAKIVLWVGSSLYLFTFVANFDDKIADRGDVGIDFEKIVFDWINRIKLPGEKQYYIPSEDESETDLISNLISPPVPGVLHEHFDLVNGGGYSTHRDADFIGQPIRMLLEKCGMTKEKAYSMMDIKNDGYSLDSEARKLATIFRLDENLFDPYNDTEALIRIGAFSDVRMLHVLRSLSWMVSRFSGQEKQKISSITFDELQKMGEVIEKRNSLNYDGQSGYPGLCGHYDWHVFYVPDAYIKAIMPRTKT